MDSQGNMSWENCTSKETNPTSHTLALLTDPPIPWVHRPLSVTSPQAALSPHLLINDTGL